MTYQKLKTFYNDNNVALNSLLWLAILGLCSQELYRSSMMVISKLETEELFFYKILFFLQMISFVFPILFVQKIKLIFGYNNIIARKFTRDEINNSTTLYALDSLLVGERSAGAFFLVMILVTALNIAPEYTNAFFERWNCYFSYSFVQVFSPEGFVTTNQKALILSSLFICYSTSLFISFFWCIIIAIFILGYAFPYLLLAVLLINFVKLPDGEKEHE